MSRVLVVAPHPDDEAIGCGGAIRQHIVQGDEVAVLLLTSGELGCPGEDLELTKLRRVHEAFEASKILGSQVIEFWEQPDGNLQISNELVERMLALFRSWRPDVIYVTGEQDSHLDHKAAAYIVQQVVITGQLVGIDIWMYEVWSPMIEYDRVEDITEHIGMKLKAIRAHDSQVNRIRFDEAALALARFRGELHNRPHGPYAEVYKKWWP